MRKLLALVLPLLLLTACLGDGQEQPLASQATPTPIATIVTTPSPTPTPTFLSPQALPPLTLDDIFPPRDLSTLNLDPDRLRTITATGDVIPARATDGAIRAHGDDFLYPVRATAHITREADLTVVNLEAPLIEACPPHNSGLIFCGRPGFVQALLEAGVDVATLENNHIGNYGPQGVAETIQHLTAAGIAYADRHTLTIREVRGLRFAFLAFNGVGEAIDRQAMVQQLATADSLVDVLVVAFHWGAEYVPLPQPAPGIAPDDPVEIAHLAVDAGADLILGNHPHWVQAVEIYKGKLIIYAHGNFIFDQMWSYETRVGVVGRYTFYDSVLVRAEFIPVLIEDYAQPRPLEGEETQAVLDGMRQTSEELADRLTQP